jgi:preprotein translocase subunit YajC
MDSVKMFLLMAAPDGGAAGSGSFITSLIPFALIIAIFYFFIIRPQNRKQKETQKMLSALKKGDRVVTIGGLHGVIQSVKDSTVVIKVDENTKVEFSRSAISSVSAQARDDKEEKEEKQIEEKKGDDGRKE